MQWLIDIISANVIATIGIPPTFIDRGDAFAWDWTKFTIDDDGTWKTWDLSGIIPVEATAVSIQTWIVINAVNEKVRFRPGAAYGTEAEAGSITQVGNIGLINDFTVAVGPNRTIQYNVTNAAWLQLNISIKGWWL